MYMGCSAVFAASTNINLSINSKVPLHGDMLRVSIDGKYFCVFSESNLKSDNIIYNIDNSADIQNNPFDIKIEYIKGSSVKSFNFRSDKKYDIALKYYFDGENVTDEN